MTTQLLVRSVYLERNGDLVVRGTVFIIDLVLIMGDRLRYTVVGVAGRDGCIVGCGWMAGDRGGWFSSTAACASVTVN
jgi:hypothetical protein